MFLLRRRSGVLYTRTETSNGSINNITLYNEILKKCAGYQLILRNVVYYSRPIHSKIYEPVT